MKKIIITEQTETEAEMVDLLQRISKLIQEGYTNGYYPNWYIENTQRNV